MKKFILFLKILLVIAVIISIATVIVIRNRDRIIKSAVELSLGWVMGAKVSIGSFYLNVNEGKLKIEEFKLYNPPGFSNAVLLDMPKIDIQLELIPLKAMRFHFYRADIHLRQLLFEKDKSGKMNVDSLKISSSWLNNKSVPLPPFKIDRLNLQVGQVVELDRRGAKPLIKAHDINLHKRYNNIASVDQLVLLLMVDPLKQAGIQGARVYGLSMLMGGPVTIPMAIAITSMGEGMVSKAVEDNIDVIYEKSLKVLDELGDITHKDKKNYVITASIQGAAVTVILRYRAAKSNLIEVGATKFMLPERQIASGVLYEILEELKTSK